MSTQQINLLNSLPKKPVDYFSFRVMTLVMAGWIGFLIVLFIALFIFQIIRANQTVQLKSEKTQLTQQLMDLSKVQAKRNATQIRITKLTNEIDLRKQALDLVSTVNKTSLSHFMHDLSQETPENLWIEQIKLILEKQTVRIEGNALHPDLVPLFMEQLANNRILKNQKISITKMTVANAGHYHFTIETHQIEVNKKDKQTIETKKEDKPTADVKKNDRSKK